MTSEINAALLQFIKDSPSAFHTCASLVKMYTEAGYTELAEGQYENLQAGHGYFVCRNQSSVIAFRVPAAPVSSAVICAAHSDSPSYKIKDNPELSSGPYLRLNTEPYGGMLPATWFDRPLSAAGRLVVRDPETEGRILTKLVRVDRDLLLIPSVAPHMAKITEFNPAVDLVPLFGTAPKNAEDAKNAFLSVVAEEAGVAVSDILGHDLFLYNRMDGLVWGQKGAFVSAPHLDDLQCAYSCAAALLRAEPLADVLPVCAIFDNEEVGSQTKQGAASTFLSDVLHGVLFSLGLNEAGYQRIVASSLMVSADNAHAVHPNHAELADPVSRPEMNRGIVIKHNAAQHYSTDAISAALFETICRHADVPVQQFFNRSDMRGGSTLGNISGTQVSLNCVDIGMAQLAMHSSFETAGAEDTAYLVRGLTAAYSAGITAEPGGHYTVRFS